MIDRIERLGVMTGGLGLIALHLLLTWKMTHQSDQLLLCALFWGAIATRLWQQRNRLNWSSDWFSSAIGLCLVGMVLVKSVSLFWFESGVLRIIPGISAMGLALLASGFHLRQYGRELALVVAMMLPPAAIATQLERLFGDSVPSGMAQAATFLLHYSGFEATRQGIDIILPTGAIQVQYGCTGIPVLILLLQLTIFFAALSPRFIRSSGVMAILAVAIAFSLSTIRIMMMAIVVHDANQFAYWHGSSGNQLFTTLAIVVFSLCCQPITRQISYASDPSPSIARSSQ